MALEAEYGLAALAVKEDQSRMEEVTDLEAQVVSGLEALEVSGLAALAVKEDQSHMVDLEITDLEVLNLVTDHLVVVTDQATLDQDMDRMEAVVDSSLEAASADLAALDLDTADSAVITAAGDLAATMAVEASDQALDTARVGTDQDPGDLDAKGVAVVSGAKIATSGHKIGQPRFT